jgi:hypothetical protein
MTIFHYTKNFGMEQVVRADVDTDSIISIEQPQPIVLMDGN